MPALCARSPETIKRLRNGLDVGIDDAELATSWWPAPLGQPPCATIC